MTEQETNYFLNKPVDKNLQKAQDITFMWGMSNCNIYEKVVLTELILNEGPSTPKEIAFRMGISESSAKRAIKSLKESGICINHPKVNGVIINDIVFW